MEMVFRNFIIFGLVQMATANEHYRHTNRKDPGRNFKLSLITLKQYDFYNKIIKKYIQSSLILL